MFLEHTGRMGAGDNSIDFGADVGGASSQSSWSTRRINTNSGAISVRSARRSPSQPALAICPLPLLLAAEMLPDWAAATMLLLSATVVGCALYHSRKLKQHKDARRRAEDALGDENARFRAIADATYDWEMWFGPDGQLLWTNPAVERIAGYSLPECAQLADFPFCLLVDKHRHRARNAHQAALAGDSSNDETFCIRHKDGRDVWISASWQPLYAPNGERDGYRVSARDISARRAIEQALRESERRLEALYDALPAHLCLIDRDGVIVAVNKAWTRFALENGCDDLARVGLGVNYLDICDRAAGPMCERADEVAAGLRALLGGQRGVYEIEYPCPGYGKERWYRLQAVPLAPDGGGVVIAHVDITAQKLAERKLWMFEAILAGSRAGILIKDPDGRPLYANPACERLFGRSLTVLRAGAAHDWYTRNSAEVRRREIAPALRAGRSWSGQLETVAADGRQVTVWEQIDAVLDDEGHRIFEVELIHAVEAEQAQRAQQNRPAAEPALLLDHLGTNVTFLAPDLRILWCNAAAAQPMGVKPSELIGKHCYEARWCSPSPCPQCYVSVALQTGEPQTGDFTDPQGRIWSVYAAPVRDEQGQVLGAVENAWEITAQRQLEKALELSETRYRQVVADQLEMICRLLPDTTITYANDAMAEFLGRTPSDLVGERLCVLAPDEAHAELLDKLARLTPAEPTDICTIAARDAHGAARSIQWTGRALYDREHALVGYQAVGRDVTAVQRAEAALRENEARLRTMAEAGQLAIYDYDLLADTAEINELYRAYFGPIAGNSPMKWWRERIHPADRDAAFTSLREAFDSGATRWEQNYRMRKADDAYIDVRDFSHIFRDRDGRPVRAIGAIRDVTSEREAQREREELIAELQTALGSIKRLRTLLPICAGCKKIRTDEGYWQAVDVYLREHADVTFSHGLCPECVTRLYPDLDGPLMPPAHDDDN